MRRTLKVIVGFAVAGAAASHQKPAHHTHDHSHTDSHLQPNPQTVQPRPIEQNLSPQNSVFVKPSLLHTASTTARSGGSR